MGSGRQLLNCALHLTAKCCGMNDMFDLNDVVLQRTAAEILPTKGRGDGFRCCRLAIIFGKATNCSAAVLALIPSPVKRRVACFVAHKLKGHAQ